MTDDRPTCFMAMPISTKPEQAALYIDEAHWRHVMEHLFVPAIVAAGFTPIVPISKGASMIHVDIVKNLEESSMVLCDFSGWNVNVFFELGVRVSLDKPMALVRDEVTEVPFDLGGVHVHEYRSGMRTWEAESEIDRLRQHLVDSVESCGGHNPLWRQFGLTLRAQEPATNETREVAKLDLLAAKVDELADGLRTGELNPERIVQQRARDNLDLWVAQGGTSTAVDQVMTSQRRHEFLTELFLNPTMDGVFISPRQVGEVIYLGLSVEEPSEALKTKLFELARRYNVPIRFEYRPWSGSSSGDD